MLKTVKTTEYISFISYAIKYTQGWLTVTIWNVNKGVKTVQCNLDWTTKQNMIDYIYKTPFKSAMLLIIINLIVCQRQNANLYIVHIKGFSIIHYSDSNAK